MGQRLESTGKVRAGELHTEPHWNGVLRPGRPVIPPHSERGGLHKRREFLLLQLLHPDVLKPSLVAVIRDHDVTVSGSKADLVLKLARRDACLPVL